MIKHEHIKHIQRVIKKFVDYAIKSILIKLCIIFHQDLTVIGHMIKHEHIKHKYTS